MYNSSALFHWQNFIGILLFIFVIANAQLLKYAHKMKWQFVWNCQEKQREKPDFTELLRFSVYLVPVVGLENNTYML